jgi:hypothetical protein
MPFCSRCGTKAEGQDLYCAGCGRPHPAAQNIGVPQSEPPKNNSIETGIISSRDYPLGRRVTVITADTFTCMVSTAKEGVFKKQTTMIVELTDPNKTILQGRAVGKLTYSSSLSSFDRLQMHDVVCRYLGAADQYETLSFLIDLIGDNLKKRGVLTEVVNLA